MIFKRFEWAVLFRVLLLAASMLLCLYFLFSTEKYVSGGIIALLVIYQIFELHYYILETNRKLTRFLEAVKYSDFTIGFNKDNQLGENFKNLNKMFNEVLDAFRKARAEKEENWQYLKTVVQHINIGLLSYDEIGKVELLNNAAKRFFNVSHLSNIHELARHEKDLYEIIYKLPPGAKTLFKQNLDHHLSINATELRLRGSSYKLVSLQNIQSELQQQEIEAWQNLTKVLRHEIMNSITPIASLAGTAIDIIEEDAMKENGKLSFEQESYDDISMSLRTIESRSKGLVNFVEAYRNFTSIPTPEFERVKIKEVIDKVMQLVRVGLSEKDVKFVVSIKPTTLIVRMDVKLIEMVLINILKNAVEAVQEVSSPQIELHVFLDQDHRVIIEVRDNGPGIEPEAMERIFIPFYTTKKTGSGIGLSLSQRIMQMHQGSLTARSAVGQGTVFILHF